MDTWEGLAFVDLPTGEIHEEKLDQNLARHFIGGYGFGVRILFERQKARIDPMGPDNKGAADRHVFLDR